jgi:hypothetical protein
MISLTATRLSSRLLLLKNWQIDFVLQQAGKCRGCSSSALVSDQRSHIDVCRHDINKVARNGGCRSSFEAGTSIFPGRPNTTTPKDEVHRSRQIIPRKYPWRFVCWRSSSTQSTISTHLVDECFQCLALLRLQRPVRQRERRRLRCSARTGTGR